MVKQANRKKPAPRARPRVVEIVEDDDQDFVSERDETIGLDSAEARFLQMLDEIGPQDQLRLAVYRLKDARGNSLPKPVYRFDIGAEEFPNLEARLQTELGTGTYRLQAYVNNLRKKQWEYAIETAPGWRPPGLEVVSTQPEKFDPVTAALLARIERLEKPAAPQVDWFGIVERGVTIATTVIGGIFGALSKVQTNTGADTLLRAVELVEKLRPSEGGSDDSIMGLVKTIVASNPGVVEKFMESAARGLPPPPSMPQPRPQHRPAVLSETTAPVPTAGNGEATPEPLSGNSPLSQMFGPMVDMLLDHAKRGHDPNVYAQVILDAVHPGALDVLLQNDDPVGWLAKMKPEVQTYRGWFDKLIDAISEPDDEAADATRIECASAGTSEHPFGNSGG